MTPSFSERAAELFVAILDIDPTDRASFLDAHCANDTGGHELRKELERLLALDGRACRFLEESPPIIQSLLTGATDALMGQTIGGYQIVRLIASGGMGTVYEAKHAQLGRSAALKIIRGGLPGAMTLRRFEHEARLLARLRHPAIAQIYEVGIHPAPGGHVPFFAMEYVGQARTILDFVNERGLTTRDRLKLFAQVCDAVHHGHQRGIIHRDLKPGNILVDESGHVKIIDFGVARLVDSEEALTTVHTNFGQLIGTLQYMSPEQCGPDPHDIDVRSDVYALGVVLYEMLVGQPPYAVQKVTLLEATRRIREQPPARLSSFNRVLRGDLDTIVLRALEKDRERRYQSAGDMNSDLEHYLRDEPIAARRDSGLYVMRKLLRRYRGIVAIATVFLLVVTASVIALSILYRRQGFLLREISHERDRAIVSEQAADEGRRKAEYEAYLANIAAADGALTANDGGAAMKRLNQAPILHRNWEWRFLNRAADSSEITVHGLDNHSIRHVVFSPDGRYLGGISHRAGAHSHLHVWDWRTGANVLNAPACDDRLTMFYFTPYCFTPDSSRVQVFPVTGTIVDYELAHGTEVSRSTFPAVPSTSRLLIAVPRGFIETHLDDSRLFVQILKQDFSVLAQFQAAGPGFFNSAGAAADGSLWALGDDDGMACVCRMDSRPNAHRFKAHSSSIHGMTFASTGHLATSSEDGSIKVWSVTDTVGTQPVGSSKPELSVRELLAFRGSTQRVGGVAFSPNAESLASASADKTLRLWNAKSGELRQTRRGHSGALCDVAYHPDGRHLATGSYDGTAKVWDAARPPDTIIRRGLPGYVDNLSFFPDGLRLIAVTTGGTLVLDTVDGRTIRDLSDKMNPDYSVHIGNQSDVFIGDREGGARGVDSESGRELKRYSLRKAGAMLIAVNRSGSQLAAVIHSGGGVSIIDPSNGGLLGNIEQAHGAAQVMDFSPINGHLATGSTSGDLCLWDASTWRPLWEVHEHAAGISSVVFSPDGTRIVTGSADGTVNSYDARSGRIQNKLNPQIGDVWCVALSPDGMRLAVGGRDRTVRVFDAVQLRELLTLRGPTGTVMSLNWSPDGRRLAAGSWANEVFIWDAGP